MKGENKGTDQFYKTRVQIKTQNTGTEHKNQGKTRVLINFSKGKNKGTDQIYKAENQNKGTDQENWEKQGYRSIMLGSNMTLCWGPT